MLIYAKNRKVEKRGQANENFANGSHLSRDQMRIFSVILKTFPHIQANLTV
jgi:hypothetical protein